MFGEYYKVVLSDNHEPFEDLFIFLTQNYKLKNNHHFPYPRNLNT